MHELLSGARYLWHGPRNFVADRPEPGPGPRLPRAAQAAHRARLRLLPLKEGEDADARPRRRRSTEIPSGTRTPSFTRSTSGPSRTATATASATSAGLAGKLDYVRDLGVTAIWLLPFYPSPLRDDGYDIADYTTVHPAYGILADFKQFLREAHARGLRVITELVVNHTSDQHPWFQRARRARPGSPRARLLRVERHHRALQGRPDHLQGLRGVELGMGPGGAGVLLAPLLLPPARPQLRQPRGA